MNFSRFVDSFYLCKLNQDSIIEPGRKLSITWLNEIDREKKEYQLFYKDTIWTDTVICEVKLVKNSRFRYILPEEGKLFVEQELKYSLEQLEKDNNENENTNNYSPAKEVENVNEINEKASETHLGDAELNDFSKVYTQRINKANTIAVVDERENLESHIINEQTHYENLDSASKQKEHFGSSVDLDRSENFKSLVNNEQVNFDNLDTNPLVQQNGNHILDHNESQYSSHVNNVEQTNFSNLDNVSLQQEETNISLDYDVPKNSESLTDKYLPDSDGHEKVKNHARNEQTYLANLDTNSFQQEDGKNIILDHTESEYTSRINIVEQAYFANLHNISVQQQEMNSNLDYDAPENLESLITNSNLPDSENLDNILTQHHVERNVELDGLEIFKNNTRNSANLDANSVQQKDGEHLTLDHNTPENTDDHTNVEEQIHSATLDNVSQQQEHVENNLDSNASENVLLIESKRQKSVCFHTMGNTKYTTINNTNECSVETGSTGKVNTDSISVSREIDEHVSSSVIITSDILLQSKTIEAPTIFEKCGVKVLGTDNQLSCNLCESDDCSCIPSSITPPFCDSGSEYVPSDTERAPRAFNVLSFEPRRPKKIDSKKCGESYMRKSSPLVLEQKPLNVEVRSKKRRHGLKIQKDSSDSTDSDITSSKVRKTKQKMSQRKPKTSTIDRHETTSDSENNDAIIIGQSKKSALNKRVYDKRHACVVCHDRFLKMARHLENKHSNNLEVARILAKPKNSAERRQGFLELQRCGDFQHNVEVLASKKGELILARRPSEKEGKEFNCFGPCPYCLGFMTKNRLWLHAKKCSKKKLTRDDALQKKSIRMESNAILNSILCKHTDAEFKRKIIDGFKNDEISEICKSDEVILIFGKLLYEKYGNSQKELIRQNMRQLGRLLNELHSNGHKQPLKHFIAAENFDKVVQAVKLVSCANLQQNQRTEYGIPSLAMKLGYHLRKCASALRGQALRDGDTIRDAKLKSFLDLLDLEWSVRISSNAILTLNNKKMNVAKLLPLTSDLVKLNKYVSQQIEYYTDLLTRQSSSKDAWYNLATLTLSRVILFNKRRGGEASRMQLSHYTTQTKWSDESTEEMQNTLSSFEKQLASELKLVQVPGKRGRTVPVLLTKEMVLAIELLISTRGSVGISTLNQYIFARIYNDSIESLRGSDCLRSVVQKAQLDSPTTITSTRLRKYVATVSQVFGLKDKEVDWLARHLGHDIRVHRDFYRLHDSAIELTKISRLLMAVDEGQVSTFEGKSLNDINLNGKYILSIIFFQLVTYRILCYRPSRYRARKRRCS